MRTRLTRVASAWRRLGPIGFGRRVLELAKDRLRRKPRWEAVWVWYELDLTRSERPRPPLPEGLELRRGQERDLPLLDELPREVWTTPMTRELAAHLLAEGAVLWLLTMGEQVAFCCWTFAGRAPLYGARGGRLHLPPGVVCLEDQVTMPAFRGRGVAPAALSAIGDALASDGVRAVVARAHLGNTASHRVVQKLGWRAVARMQIVEQDWRTRIRVVFPRYDPEHRWLASLDRG